ncbi:hypothetical protein CHLRE_01g008000v5 [Chlamydomonas reinhardtii]|uniref:K Homology domain-containing protein n=1 Tax=Chlamydomonas reinhardtii TaxID=3055 RepID=A0A2K3E570_CHLRE|nr:uncharacterized protein CHLRE_01g008000v5 [Chlamydomonas reinhardtii]PNW87945.1 hypothetical protein CHLRE_01g008000v5 [Chlamydomonas reinhardtii]
MTGPDVLHPPLVHVGGRNYRVQGTAASTFSHLPERGEHAAGRPAAPRHYDDDDEEDFNAASSGGAEPSIDESLITQDQSGQFQARLSCDPEVYPMLIGKEGAKKKRLEAETGATLIIPRKTAAGPQGGGGGGDVTIRGPSKAVVASGYLRTELAMAEAVAGRLLDYNYFLSLPLATPATVRQFEAFRKGVLGDPKVCPPGCGLEPSVFMAPQQLHLTLVMLKLYSDQKRHAAQQALDRLRPRVGALLAGQPLKVHLQGLEYMNDDPSAMHVLYLKVADMGPGGRLEALCDMVVEEFGRAGLLLPQDDRKVKLHATIINTRYRKRGAEQQQGGGGGGSSSQQQRPQQGGRPSDRQPFDGRALLEQHGRLDLGIHTLQAVHLSQRGAYGEDGYYRCVRQLPLQPLQAEAEAGAGAGADE